MGTWADLSGAGNDATQATTGAQSIYVASSSAWNGLASIHPCANMSFAGNTFDFDNMGSSYCKFDLADFAAAWLADGLF